MDNRHRLSDRFSVWRGIELAASGTASAALKEHSDGNGDLLKWTSGFRNSSLKKGLKSTRERKEIVDAIMETTGHFDPEELYNRLRACGSKVSRASVYRTIPLLIESGFIEEVERVDKHSHYERVIGTPHHDHMICTQCGKVIESIHPLLRCCRTNSVPRKNSGRSGIIWKSWAFVQDAAVSMRSAALCV